MPKNCVGLDIGSSAIKVVHLKETGKGYQLVNFGVETLPPQTIVDGAIMNQSAVVDAIRSLTTALRLRSRDVATAISGHSVIVKKIKVPQMTPEELEEQIPWEAEHHIPFSKDDVEIDHQVLARPEGETQMELMLVAAKKEVVSDYSLVIREAKLNPTVMDVAAFTIQNAFEVNYEVPQNEAVALINVGAALTTINILAGGSSVFTRDVADGGNAFTEELQKRLSVSHEEAEAWKIGASGDRPDEAVPKAVESILAEVAETMAGKFQRSLDFYLSANADASLSRIYLCGGSSKVAALQKALEEKSRTPVEILDPFKNVSVDGKKFDAAFLAQHAPQAVVALGLALRRAGDKT
jgi:type IV pilus assembly protein PilM